VRAEGSTDGFEVSAKIVTLERGYVAQGLASTGHLAHVVGLFDLAGSVSDRKATRALAYPRDTGHVGLQPSEVAQAEARLVLVVMVWGDLGHDAPSGVA
jgi:hypothetical protein